jgi:alpha-glucosidase
MPCSRSARKPSVKSEKSSSPAEPPARVAPRADACFTAASRSSKMPPVSWSRRPISVDLPSSTEPKAVLRRRHVAVAPRAILRAMSNRPSLLMCACAIVMLGSCGDDLRGAPTVLDADGVRVTVWESPARIEVVRIADGAVIFDGAPGGAASSVDPPHVALAFRQATPTIETQVGAFKIEDDRDAVWSGVVTFQESYLPGDGTMRLVLAGADGRRLGHATIAIAPVTGATAGAGVEVGITATADGAANRASIAFACNPDEHFLGLGGQSFDVDHRGQTGPLWVEEDGIGTRADHSYDGVWFLSGRRHSTHTPMPIAVSSRGFGFAVATDARAVFALCSEPDSAGDLVRLETWEGTIDLHLFVADPEADDPRVALARTLDLQTAWTGRPDLARPITFAPWVDAIYGQAEVQRVADALRADDIAASVIWSEDWRGANDEGTGYVLEEDWRLDPELYPDATGLTDHLHGDGFRWQVYVNTFVDETADIHDEAFAAGYTIHDAEGAPYQFTGVKFRPTSMIDLTNPAAVAWTQAVFREALAAGADGWMADYGEWLPHDAVLADGSDALAAGHNRYPVQWAKLVHELAVERVDDDPAGLVSYMRSAWLGSQPYASVLWAGDQQTDWSEGDGMPSVIPIELGLGVTGFPYVGHDIGGYMSQTTVPTTKELWFRWCSLGALTPVMRTHHGRSARMNWSWEKDAETIDHMRRWTKLHQQLLPYFEVSAANAAATGMPIMRPVALGYPDAGAWAWTATDEYLLGDRILVAPVVIEGATDRDVQLPEGRWYPLVSGVGGSIEGGGRVTVDAPVTEIPAFLPEGTILALLPPEVDSVVEAPDDDATVTTADIGNARILIVTGGTASRPSLATLPLFDGVLTWSGRDPTLPAPTVVTVAGVDLPLVAHDGYLSVTIPTLARVDVEGGGVLETTTSAVAGPFELRIEP